MDRVKLSFKSGLVCCFTPYQKNKSAIFAACAAKVVLDFNGRVDSRGGLLNARRYLWLLSSSHVRDREKGCWETSLSGGVWNGFLLEHIRGEFLCRCCVAAVKDGHLFWKCTHTFLVHIREGPEFQVLVKRDNRHWPRCLLWHGWLCALACGLWSFMNTDGSAPMAPTMRMCCDSWFCRSRQRKVWLILLSHSSPDVWFFERFIIIELDLCWIWYIYSIYLFQRPW